MKTFSPKLDIISENILYLLSINSRISISKLSKALSTKRKIVENRIKKLYNQDFIKPLLVYNHPEIVKATILLKLSKFDEKTIKAVVQLKRFIKVKETLGEYDLSLFVISEKKEALNSILNKINYLFHSSIQKMDLIIHPFEDTLGYKSFCHDFKLLKNYGFLESTQKKPLKNEESFFINQLKPNPLISYQDLMKKTDLKFNKLKLIISNLMNNKVIRFSIDPNYQRLGLEFHNVLIKINLAKKAPFEKNMITNPAVHWIKKGLGPWDYIISIASKNINEFIQNVRRIRTENKNTLLNFSSLISNIHVRRES